MTIWADPVGSGGLRGCPTIICPQEETPILRDAPVEALQDRPSGTSPRDIDRELRAAIGAKLYGFVQLRRAALGAEQSINISLRLIG
jgi:hypothetical protein